MTKGLPDLLTNSDIAPLFLFQHHKLHYVVATYYFYRLSINDANLYANHTETFWSFIKHSGKTSID